MRCAKARMIARSATQVVSVIRSQGARQSERRALAQPGGTGVWRAAGVVARLVKGSTIHCATRLAQRCVSHPATPPSHIQFLLK